MFSIEATAWKQERQIEELQRDLEMERKVSAWLVEYWGEAGVRVDDERLRKELFARFARERNEPEAAK